MIPTEEHIRIGVAYFQAPMTFFWRWGSEGKTIELQDGKTLCFRKELEDYLDALEDRGLPSLSSILLVIAACQDHFKDSSVTAEGLQKYAQQSGEVLPDEFQEICSLVTRVNDLPKAFRAPQHRGWLLRALFRDNDSAHAAVSFLDTKDVLYAFKQGKIDPWLNHVAIPDEPVNEAVWPLIGASKEFPTYLALDTFVRTGLKDVPKPAEITLPPPPEPEGEPSLIRELLEDNRTCGIAHLAQHLVAALNIPMQARGSNDMPIGGVSDITNKGNLDRLLLSELAQDDTTLMARLANNEALYLRREEPPLKVERERIVLVDATLRLWGLPRVFAISAALACKLTLEAGLPLRAFSLGGTHYFATDLSAKSGVLDALSRLDAHLDCSESLENCLNEVGRAGKEVIFITGLENLHSPEFAAKVISLQPQLDVLIGLGRDGRMELYEIKGGRRKLHSSATFDLGDLLFRLPARKKASDREPQRPMDDLMPSFFSQVPAPLHFPAISMRLRSTNTRKLTSTRIAVITDSRRVLLWQIAGMGALQMLPYLEEADLICIEEEVLARAVLIFMQDSAKKVLKIHRYDLTSHEVQTLDLTHLETGHYVSFGMHEAKPVRVKNFHCDVQTGQIEELPANFSFVKRIDPMGTHKFHKADLKNIINSGYSTICKAKRIGITEDGHLVSDGNRLIISETFHRELIWQQNHTEKRPVTLGHTEPEIQSLPLYAGGPPAMRRTTWADGTIAYMDPRGFLHLRSSDPNLPQVSIATIVGQPTAAWASDGEWVGHHYFFYHRRDKQITIDAFFAKYLQPIFQRILNHK
ncbi:MAG: hypothetical protein RLZZ519_1770 [Bacteroidota bacterium]|jgi:hypothetical protein